MELERLEGLLETRVPGLMDATGKFAVLVPLVQRADGLYLLYEVRARHMERQPGEVCFPGGRMEPGESAQECALRETQEELAISRDAVRVLGELDFIAHRANFIMRPILALVDEGAVDNMCPNPAEVGETFLVPLQHLLENDPAVYEYQFLPDPAAEFPYEQMNIPKDYNWQPGVEQIPVYPWQGHAIWGLTARITRHLIALIRESGANR